METFRIYSPFDKHEFIRAQLITWEIYWMKNKRQLIYYSIASALVFVIGVAIKSEEEIGNPLIYTGLIFSLLILFLLYIRLLSKQNFKTKIYKNAEEFDAIRMDCSYEFSDDSVKYWDLEKKLEFKWTVFTEYTIYKNYLVLKNPFVGAYVFEKKEKENENYNNILEITKLKVKYKPLKNNTFANISYKTLLGKR